MVDEIPWLEEWCSVNIKAARADDFGLAHRLATGAAAAAATKGILLGPAVVALGYPTLEDYMLEQLNAKVDAAVMKDKRSSRRHSGYGRRAHQPDPNAKYGFHNDPRREPPGRKRTAQ